MPGFDELLPDESPVDASHLLVPDVGSRAELSVAEGRQIFKVLRKYFHPRTPIATIGHDCGTVQLPGR